MTSIRHILHTIGHITIQRRMKCQVEETEAFLKHKTKKSKPKTRKQQT